MAAASKYFDPMFELARSGIQGAQKDIYGFIRNVGQRQGHLGAMQMAAQAVAPFAQEIGRAGATAAAEAQRMEEQMKLYEQQKEQWEKQFAANEAERERRNQMERERFEYEKEQWEKEARLKNLGVTGFNPMIMQDLGYDTMRYPMRNQGTYAGQLNMGMGFGPQGPGSQYGAMGYGPMPIGSYNPQFGRTSMRSRPDNLLSPAELFYQKQAMGYY